MKKLICVILTVVMVLTPATAAFAKQKHNQPKSEKQHSQEQIKEHAHEQEQVKEHAHEQEQEHAQEQHNKKIKESKQTFKINGSPVIKYGKYKIPISPITKGMGAVVSFDKATAVLTITKDTKIIVFDFMNKTVTINGVADTQSGIFTAKNEHKMTVLIKYVANALGVRVTVGDDKVTVIVPGLDFPTSVTVTPVGGTVVANSLNSTNLFVAATANIKAGQATGGKAELYVGTKLVATDATIAATDTTVTFATADDTPSNAELQAAVPVGGVVTVKLYNASNVSVTSTTANPTLLVDYVVPTVTGITSAIHSVSGSAISITITGGTTTGDKVDVTKLSLYDTALARTYQLTNAAVTGSSGVVTNENTLTINLGSVDKLGLAGFGTSTVVLNIAAGSLLSDTAGNVSAAFVTSQAIPVVIIP